MSADLKMATSSKIKIMISSRCSDLFPLADAQARTLSEIRARLKEEIEAIKIFGHPIYDVWINEKEAEDGSQQAWDHCMDQARDCDIFIALFNGKAGWADAAERSVFAMRNSKRPILAPPGRSSSSTYANKAWGRPQPEQMIARFRMKSSVYEDLTPEPQRVKRSFSR